MARATTLLDRQKQLERAEKTIEAKLTELKRLVTSIRMWQRRRAYYARQVLMTDEERETLRLLREARASASRQRHRRIKL